MSLQNPLIANEAMYSNEAGDYFYPQTVAKQVLMEDGNRLDAYLGGMVIPNGMELLWENPDPTAAFAAQTITLDTLKYSKFIVEAYFDTGNVELTTSFINEKNITYMMSAFRDVGMWIGYRTINITDNAVKFGTPRCQGSDPDAPSWCIPYKIYGIKENATIGGESTLLNANMLGGVAAEEYVKKSETGMDLLWENASPTSEMAAQTITTPDTSSYKKIGFLARAGAGYSYYEFPNNLNTVFRFAQSSFGVGTNQGGTFMRDITITSSTQISVTSATYDGKNNTNFETYNFGAVIAKIYGIK